MAAGVRKLYVGTKKNSVASGTMCNLTIPGSVWPAHFKASCIKRPALHAFPSKKIRPAGPHLVWGSGLWSERVKVGGKFSRPDPQVILHQAHQAHLEKPRPSAAPTKL